MIDTNLAYRLWKEMWEILAQTGDDTKHRALTQMQTSHGEEEINTYFVANILCPACEVAKNMATTVYFSYCVNCPLTWSNKQKCLGPDSLFNKWVDAESQEERQALAKKISRRKWHHPLTKERIT